MYTSCNHSGQHHVSERERERGERERENERERETRDERERGQEVERLKERQRLEVERLHAQTLNTLAHNQLQHLDSSMQ